MATAVSNKHVPLVSSGTAGPLGATHLPRLWLKLTLGTNDMLADGYDFCGQGFDQMTLDALGLDREKTIAFVRDKKPSYMEFEEYVVEQNGGAVSKERIDKHNAAIRGYNHADDLAKSMRHASGNRHEHVKDAVTLNTIEDLDEVHHQVKGAK
jgi:hypothetical protein